MIRPTPPARPGSRPPRRRPEVEPLEDRLVPAANGLANLNFMARAERDVLHHPLDGLGIALARRLDHGASRVAVIRVFEHSGAFEAALVNDAFLQILGHGPDAAGMAGGLHLLRHGGRILDLEVRLAGSDEFFLENGGTVDGFLAGLYSVGAGRLPNPAEQVSGDAALTRGESRLAVARGVLEGPAGLAFQTDTVFVTLLRHHAEGGELGQGVLLLSRHGLEGLIAAVLSSGEYYHLSNVHATHLIFLGQPGTQTAGGAFATAAAAVDDLGQLDVTFNGPVTVGLGADPAGGRLQGTPTQTATAGVVVFGPLAISKAGSGYTVTVSTPGLGGAVTGPFTVNPASADRLVFTEQPPNPAAAGQGFTVQVTAEDSFGNVDTNYNGSVSLTIDPQHNPTGTKLHQGANLQPQDPRTATADHGVATFTDVSIQTANEDAAKGHYELLAAAGGLQSGDSTAFDVTPAAASQLVFTELANQQTEQGEMPEQNEQVGLDAQVVSNTPFEAEVTVEDRFGNAVPNFLGTVSVAIGNNPSNGTLRGGNLTATADGRGIATFSGLMIDKAGQGYTLTAQSGTLQGTSNSFDVLAANAATLSISHIDDVGQFATFGVTVTVTDSAGNPVPNVQVTLGIDPNHTGGGGALSGNLTSTSNRNGVATFTGLSIDKAGPNYALRATASNSVNAPSNTFTVLAPTVSVSFANNPPDQLGRTNGFVTLTATITVPSGSPAPSGGTVTFTTSAQANALGSTMTLTQTGPQTYQASVMNVQPPPQDQTITATYSGDQRYSTISGSEAITFRDPDDPNGINNDTDYDGDETFAPS